MSLEVALIQLAYGDDESLTDRTHRVCRLVREQEGADLVVLPELWGPTGFDYTRWQDAAQGVDGPVVTALREAAREAGVTLHAGSIIERAEPDGRDVRDAAQGSDQPTNGQQPHGLWNTSVLLDPAGEVLGSYRKIHRFGFGSGEPKLLDAGRDVLVVDLADRAGGGIRAGISTCYDLRFPELYRRQVDDGAQLLLAVAAWPMARVEHWRLLLRARAVENQAWVLGCNTAGTHGGTQMGGHSACVDPQGRVVAEAGDGEEVLRVSVDPGAVARYRESFPALADRRL